MINKKSVKHRNIPVQRFFVLFAVAVLSLFFSVNVQAKETKRSMPVNYQETCGIFIIMMTYR